jgi:hypothetical protein
LDTDVWAIDIDDTNEGMNEDLHDVGEAANGAFALDSRLRGSGGRVRCSGDGAAIVDLHDESPIQVEARSGGAVHRV